MINLGLVVVDKGNVVEVEIPMHKITLGTNDPYNFFKAHLRHIFQDFEHEYNKSKILIGKDSFNDKDK